MTANSMIKFTVKSEYYQDPGTEPGYDKQSIDGSTRELPGSGNFSICKDNYTCKVCSRVSVSGINTIVAGEVQEGVGDGGVVYEGGGEMADGTRGASMNK